jgi:GntR family transcriptional repressor for pyruvate dehydrogenase complex
MESLLIGLTVKQIKRYIFDHKLTSGDKLPPERKLAQVFGVSRTVVRDAIKTLAGKGALAVRPRVGVFVAEALEQTVSQKLSNLLVVNHYTARHLFEVRLALETAVAGWAAQNRDETGLGRLDGLLSEIERCLEGNCSTAEFGRLDRRFHLLIAELSGNAIARDLMSNLMVYFESMSRHTHRIPRRVEHSAGQHVLICKAIRAGDAARARKAMASHIRSVYNAIQKSWLDT